MTVIEHTALPKEWGIKKYEGKVRDVYELGEDSLLIIATDRLSAFDKQVGLIPGRGQILNQLSAWWFNQTSDIVPNHMISIPHPNAMIVKKYPRVNLEMVVRGFNTGSTTTSIWKRYENGQREFGGVVLPDGMKKNDPLPTPILDPTSKAAVGHDQNLTRDAIINSGIVTEDEYAEIIKISLDLFARGQKLSERAGLTLVDTKYEFGKDVETGKFILIDEIHTPDSSRFWKVGTKESYDKEFIRLWFSEQGLKGDDNLLQIPEAVVNEAKRRYTFVYESLTGERLKESKTDINEYITILISQILNKNV